MQQHWRHFHTDPLNLSCIVCELCSEECRRVLLLVEPGHLLVEDGPEGGCTQTPSQATTRQKEHHILQQNKKKELSFKLKGQEINEVTVQVSHSLNNLLEFDVMETLIKALYCWFHLRLNIPYLYVCSKNWWHEQTIHFLQKCSNSGKINSTTST